MERITAKPTTDPAPPIFGEPVPTLMMVQAQVEACPGSLAIIDVDGSVVTYGELWGQATDLAEGLNIERGEVAGLCLPRGAGIVVAMIAVMMRGGVYVPFSPDDPQVRTENLRERIGVRCMIESEGSRSVVRSRDGVAARVLDMSSDAPDCPIYVMWTSGSTGEPKAVVVPHRGVTRLIRDHAFMDIGPQDRVAFASNSMFDAATWEVWAALGNGAGLVVISPDDLVDARRMRSRFEQTGVTHTFLTTSLFNHLVRSDPMMFGSLTSVSVGGEALNPSAIRAVLESGSAPTSLINAYGPTECTTFSAWGLIEHVPADAQRIPIGGPLMETELAVVDADGSPIFDGEEGELWIAGTGVALGYLGAPPEMERFVETTLLGHRGDRWYRTGDLVQRLPDGSFDCLGRIDRQIKIHGYRIEPGEIEGALISRPGVSAASVIALRSGSSVSLIGFLVALSHHEVNPDAILRDLRQMFPHYMVPARLLLLDHLPITANGKLDEDRLHALARSAPPSADQPGFEQPADVDSEDPNAYLDLVAEFVLECARSILGDGQLRAEDDIWAAGLDSLAAIELLDTINGGEFGELAAPDFAGMTTVAELSQALRTSPVGDSETGRVSTSVRLNPAGTAPPLFAIPGAAGTSAQFMHLARALGTDQPIVVIGSSGLHHPGPVHRTIDAMAEHAIGEIDEVRRPGDLCLLLGFSSGASVAYESARRLRDCGVDVHLVILDAIPGLANGEQLALVRPAPPITERPPFHVRLRQRGLLDTVARAPAALRARRRLQRIEQYVAKPGPPSFDLERYAAFALIQKRAVEQYVAEPAGLPATLIRVDDGPLELLGRDLFDHLDVYVVGGVHETMLDVDHAPEVAAIIAATIAAR